MVATTSTKKRKRSTLSQRVSAADKKYTDSEIRSLLYVVRSLRSSWSNIDPYKGRMLVQYVLADIPSMSFFGLTCEEQHNIMRLQPRTPARAFHSALRTQAGICVTVVRRSDMLAQEKKRVKYREEDGVRYYPLKA